MDPQEPPGELTSLLGLAQQGTLEISDRPNRDPRIVTLQGLSCILYGGVALVFPALTLALFTSLFASFALLFGALSFSSLVALPAFSRVWFQTLAESAVAIGAGLIALLAPNTTATFMLHLTILWSVLTGISQTVSAALNPMEMSLRVATMLNGLSLLALSWFLYSNAQTLGLLSLVWVIALQAIVNGFFMLLAAGLTAKFRRDMYGRISGSAFDRDALSL